MNSKEEGLVLLPDYIPGQDHFRQEVLAGLRKSPKELPCKYFYDEQGSHLFERICALDEYYIPRTERAIMEAYIEEVADILGANVFLIEYGSGNSAKTRILLDHLRQPAAYVPIDISRQHLWRVAKELTSDYPLLEVLPVCADYTGNFELPVPQRLYHHRVVYFPGSTIGNFDPAQAKHFLEHIADVCRGGGLLIGVDLKKDPNILHRAYNDSQGVTAAFNRNLLKRLNRELGFNFQLESFQHYAFYNPGEGRVEMHLVSLKDQIVRMDEVTIPLARGESIRTENSYKFSLDQFRRLAVASGFRVERVWTDEQRWFSLQYLVSTGV